MKVKAMEKSFEKKLQKVAVETENALGVFQDTIGKLSKANEELEAVRIQAVNQVEYHKAIANETVNRQESNRKIISKIKSLID